MVNVGSSLLKKIGGIKNMKNNFLSLMDTTKKKAGVALLCGAFVATTYAGTVFATGARTSMKVKIENGVRSYSTDSGKTWSEKAPVGVTIKEDGKILFEKGNLPKDANGKKIMVKMENGVRSYSTDDGKTWSQKAPEGVTIGKDDEMFRIKGNLPIPADGKSLMFKMVNGVRSYSTDGGKTWSEKTPEGVTIGEDGEIIHMKGNLPIASDGKRLLVKIINGVRSYSTDGGKTWSVKAPEGVTIGEDDQFFHMEGSMTKADDL